MKCQYLYTIHIYICIHTCLLTSFHPNYNGFKVMFYLIECPSKNHSIFPLDWAFLMFQMVKEPAWNAEDPGLILGLERSLVKGMTTHSSILAWRIPCPEEPVGLQSMGSQKVRHDWATNTSTWLRIYCRELALDSTFF